MRNNRRDESKNEKRKKSNNSSRNSNTKYLGHATVGGRERRTHLPLDGKAFFGAQKFPTAKDPQLRHHPVYKQT